MLSDKKLARIEKTLGQDSIALLSALDVSHLKDTIANAEGSIKQAQDELEANTVYQELKEHLKALSGGLSEVKKRQQAIIQYSLHMLEEKGKQ